MKTCIILFLFLFQDPSVDSLKLFPQYDKSLIEKANTAAYVEYLDETEKQVIFYINLCRLNPPLFSKTYVKFYCDSLKLKGGYVSSLHRDLLKTPPLNVLEVNEKLCKMAAAHAKEMGNAGRDGHNGVGKTFKEREIKFLGESNIVGENCDYGNGKALDIVMALLIDKDIPSVGHRKNILASSYSEIGSGFHSHIKYDYNCVIDFK
jgi:hypothetical protein